MLQDYMNYALNQLVNPFTFVKLLNENAKIPTREAKRQRVMTFIQQMRL